MHGVAQNSPGEVGLRKRNNIQHPQWLSGRCFGIGLQVEVQVTVITIEKW